MADIKAIIFDSDGTLLDSFDVILGAYTYIAQTLGYATPTADDVRDKLRVALPITQILQSFFPGHDLTELVRLNGEYISKNAATATAFDGVKGLLQKIQAEHLKMAIVTGGNNMIHRMMEHHSFNQYFASIVHCDRVAFSKPNPEGFLLALEECDVTPSEAIMVGDSPNDILAGKNGHAAFTVGVTHGHASRADLQAADADYIVDNIQEMEALLLRLAKKA